MSTWSELRTTLELPKRRATWVALWLALVLLAAGWLLQERVAAPSSNDLDYSELRAFVEQGKVDLVVIRGQTVEGEFLEPQQVAGQRGHFFRATVPANDPSFWSLLHERRVRIRVIATGPGLLTRLVIGALPLVLFLGIALWVARGAPSATPGSVVPRGARQA